MRYLNSLHPRQAVRCGGLFAAAANDYPTFTLFNNGSGPYALAVRTFSVSSSGAAFMQAWMDRTNDIVTAATLAPIFTSEAAPVGLAGFHSAGSTTAGDSAYVANADNDSQWPGPLPFCFLTAGYALHFQGNTPSGEIAVQLVYEWLRVEQIDEDALLQSQLMIAGMNGQ